MDYKLGARPPILSLERLRLSDYLLVEMPAPPPSAEWLSGVTDWPMYGNDQYGDCVFAAIGHQIESFTYYGQGATVEVPTAAILKGYSDVTGFDPADPNTDQGTVVQEALAYWRKTGIGEGKANHKILAYAEVDVTDVSALNTAVALFGSVHIAINFPRSAMGQFNAGQPWDVVRSDGGIEGGHAIHLGGYKAGMREVITWGARQGMTDAFWKKYAAEAWVTIDQEWVNTAGATPSGLDIATFGADFSEMTHQPSPFPPNPNPTPPIPTDPQAVQIAAARKWLTYHHSAPNNVAFAKATRAWLDTVG